MGLGRGPRAPLGAGDGRAPGDARPAGAPARAPRQRVPGAGLPAPPAHPAGARVQGRRRAARASGRSDTLPSRAPGSSLGALGQARPSPFDPSPPFSVLSPLCSAPRVSKGDGNLAWVRESPLARLTLARPLGHGPTAVLWRALGERPGPEGPQRPAGSLRSGRSYRPSAKNGSTRDRPRLC